VLLHGQGGWAGMWLPVAADLVRTHRVIAPDLPGLGASIAARFAVAHPDRLSRLVLVDAGSLARFRPAPGVLVALVRFIARPTERTQQGFLRQVAVDPARARALLGADAQAYGLELARTPSVRAANRWPLEVIEDAGHLSIERPEAFRAALRSALER
jgi:pimeloyl-ACP methyl ester carboxylesterase